MDISLNLNSKVVLVEYITGTVGAALLQYYD